MCVPVSLRLTRKKATWDGFRDTVGVHLHLAGVRTGSALQEAVSVHIPGHRPREDVDAELTASTADAVLEFSVLTLVNASFFFCTSSRCSATQSCLLNVSVRQCFLVFELLLLRRSIAVVILASKLHHFFTRASWATTVTLILDDQLLAFTAERYDRRCDAEKLRVFSNLKTCVFLLICESLAS